jgi:hypothetical protein
MPTPQGQPGRVPAKTSINERRPCEWGTRENGRRVESKDKENMKTKKPDTSQLSLHACWNFIKNCIHVYLS